jgi:hypothetical protein
MFGGRLKAERERRGVALASVSASTKIPLALLQALERNDLSRWPHGIYRRAFVRAYLDAVGLVADPWLREFASVFPDDDGAPAAPANAAAAGAAPPAQEEAGPLALMLADEDGSPRKARYLHLLALLVEWSAVVLVGSSASWAAGASVLTGAGVAALLYYPLMNASRRGSLALRWARKHGFRPLQPGPQTFERGSRVQPALHGAGDSAAGQVAAGLGRTRIGLLVPRQRDTEAYALPAAGAIRCALQDLWSTTRAFPEHVARAAWRTAGRRKV